jgi:probable rRNA maturation factor
MIASCPGLSSDSNASMVLYSCKANVVFWGLFTNFEIMNAAHTTVSFFFEHPVTLRHRRLLQQFIVRLFRSEGKKLEHLNYIFCSDEKVLDINKTYLKHDYYTDIITFELQGKNEPVQGDIFISVERVKDNAIQLSQTQTRELHRVIFHGALHLCGYRDKSAKEEKLMRAKEDHYLAKYQEFLAKQDK